MTAGTGTATPGEPPRRRGEGASADEHYAVACIASAEVLTREGYESNAAELRRLGERARHSTSVSPVVQW